jgi:hypothetical protein
MKCPGQDTRYWKPGDIFEVECPQCGGKVEFFKDEATRKCRSCRTTVVNPKMDFGCAAYCKYAADCLGELGPELLARRSDLLKDRVAIEVKRLIGRDFRRIAHAVRVARFVEEITRSEKAEPALLLCAAYLHLLAEQQAGGDLIEGKENEARLVLEGLGAGQELIDKVLDVLCAFRRGDPGDSVHRRVFFDAHRLAAIEEQRGARPEGGMNGDGDETFLTPTGRNLGSKLSGSRAQAEHTL